MDVINRDGTSGYEFVLANGMSPEDVVLVHREALRVLRSAIDTAHLDAYSDDVWSREVRHSYERVLSLAQEAVADGSRSRRGDPGMGIDIDVRDDAQFELLLDLAPYTIHAEAWRGDQQVYSASDTGTSLWISVTPEQRAELLSRLDSLGIPPTALTPWVSEANSRFRRLRQWAATELERVMSASRGRA
ncbi:hypothetical protein [Streptomyces sp. NPDC086182]|uniref:hypothetical protein n=1 Tax=Streptomyces sp. NPDC086182 TaxID=3155058 RepID=UPI0034326644